MIEFLFVNAINDELIEYLESIGYKELATSKFIREHKTVKYTGLLVSRLDKSFNATNYKVQHTMLYNDADRLWCDCEDNIDKFKNLAYYLLNYKNDNRDIITAKDLIDKLLSFDKDTVIKVFNYIDGGNDVNIKNIFNNKDGTATIMLCYDNI